MKLHPSFMPIVVAAAGSVLGLASAHAVPYTQATVTRLENKVSYGTQQGNTSSTRPAEVKDVVKANTFLLSESQSRAELQYVDGTIVRVGQNTLFSFSANSRTLTLSKGVFYFYVPKGSGGATIKTPSLAAAITGTVGRVTRDSITILDGSIRLIPSRRTVLAGQYARKNRDGSITIAYFDKAFAPGGIIAPDGAAIAKSLERDVLTLKKYSAKNPPKPLPVAKPGNVMTQTAAHNAAQDAAHTAARDTTRTATTTAAKQSAAAAAAAASQEAAKQASKSASKGASKEAAKPSVPHPSYPPHP